jgi:hypothetical protein
MTQANLVIIIAGSALLTLIGGVAGLRAVFASFDQQARNRLFALNAGLGCERG